MRKLDRRSHVKVSTVVGLRRPRSKNDGLRLGACHYDCVALVVSGPFIPIDLLAAR